MHLHRGMERTKAAYFNLGIPLVTGQTDSTIHIRNCNFQPLVHGSSMTPSPPSDTHIEQLLLRALLTLVWDLYKTKIKCIKEKKNIQE